MTKYRMLKKRINMFEQNMNSIDYPVESMRFQNILAPKTYWTFKYLNELVNKSMSGARSPEALSHLKTVFYTIYFELSVMTSIPLIVILIIMVKAVRK